MICKECGAYNPDHATYCKVCAANLTASAPVQTPAAPEEDMQPTKRFTRPSWVIPEQTRQAETQSKPIEEEPVKKAKAPVMEEPEQPVEKKEPEPEPVEEDVPEEEEEVLWMPTPVKRSPRKAAPARKQKEDVEDLDDDSDDDLMGEEPEQEELPQEEETEDDIYNEEEALENDDGSFEYEPTPPKRKSSKKKNNTLFTVLLIAIIVVIVCILVAGGLFLLSTNGVLKCAGSDLSSMKSCSGSQSTSTVTEPTDAPALPTEAPTQGTSAQMPNESEATLEESVGDDGSDVLRITVLVPAKATMTLSLPNPDMEDYVKTNSDDVAKLFAVKVDASAFYTDTPLDAASATQVFEPQITITTADNQSYKVKCPSFTRTFSALSITLTSPLAKEDGTIMANEGNVVHIEGNVNQDRRVTLTINGDQTNVYENGVFMYDYTLQGDASETITLVATKENYVSASTEIRVDPYVFVPEAMVLDVNGDMTTLRADSSGKLTVTGTTLPGATVTAVSDNTTSVFCGTVNVDGEGKFTMQITMPDFYGISRITMNASKEGADDGSTSFVVSRSYKDKDEFIKAYNKNKCYKEVNGKITIADMLANQSVYATGNYGFRITATVAEVLTVNGEQIVRMNIAKTNETVYVHNMSTKWNPSDNVGKKYNIYGNFIGEYEDTGCVEFIGWFAKSAK